LRNGFIFVIGNRDSLSKAFTLGDIGPYHPGMTITLTREQLYDRVWTEPIDRICGDFGLSNLGLRKLCLRHEIPVPWRGYWAQRQHGHKVRQPPLPTLSDPIVP
jgi:hypothetical protein